MASTISPMRLLIDIRKFQEETLMLTAAERGAFLSLQMFYWRNGPIPDRDPALAQIVGMDLREWKTARRSLEPMFSVGLGEWFRDDWNEQLEAAYESINRASAAGKTAANARWARQKQVDNWYESGSNRMRSGVRSVCEPECVANVLGMVEPDSPRMLNTKGPKTPAKARAVSDHAGDFADDVAIAEASFLAPRNNLDAPTPLAGAVAAVEEKKEAGNGRC